MITDKELLKAAWPDLYLDLPGLSTVGGWMCTGNVQTGIEQGGFGSLWQTPVPLDTNGEIVWAAMESGGFDTLFVPHSLKVTEEFEGQEGINRWIKARDEGELLPCVDMRDTASWACLLLDLARGVFGGEPDETWAPGLHWSQAGRGWLLSLGQSRVAVFSDDRNANIGMGSTPLVLLPGPATASPEKALVLARAALRPEEEGLS